MILLASAATAFVLPARRLASVHPRQVLRPRTTQLRAADDPEALLAQAAALRDEAKAMEQAFAKADVNGDGVVTVDELKATLEQVFVTDNENKRDASKVERLLASEKKYVEQLVNA